MKLFFVLAFAFCSIAAGPLVNLDTDSPYYPHRNYPKLTTPQWVGEEGVEAVVILAIDDMRDHRPYELFCRPIWDRLKKIDGRSPFSIMTCKIDPATPMLQEWIKDGISIEAHTFDHPCPIWKLGDLQKAKGTYDKCIDQIFQIPNNVPVAFRTPCCDSQNTPSPRIWAEIFGKTTPAGHFLSIDSTVFNITTANDPELPRELVLDKDGREKFRKYVPFDSFVNTIEDYPYPYIMAGVCCQFPGATPSDWQGQYVNKDASPITLEDWKAQLDATVIKRGVMTTVFHPYKWSTPQQWVEFIDYATSKYGKRIKFINFRQAHDLLTKNLLDNVPLRDKSGKPSNVQLADLNKDGYLDVILPDKARIWNSVSKIWTEAPYPAYLKAAQAMSTDQSPGYLRDLDHDGQSELVIDNAVFGWDGSAWKKKPFALPSGVAISAGVLFADIDEDGHDDLVFSSADRSALYLFSAGRGWTQTDMGMKGRLPLIRLADGTNNGCWVHSRHLWWQNEGTLGLKNFVERYDFNYLLKDTPPTAKSPAASLACMKVAPGYRVELVAAEPLVQDPIAFSFGPDGKLWVVEMADYPAGHPPLAGDPKAQFQTGKPGGRVRYLEDTDGDGVYDKSTVFLSDLNFPTSVLPWKKGVLIAAAPDIIYAEDTDGDGKADVRKVLFTGFKEGNQQHRLNHLSYGLDNWVYGANGDSGGNVKSVQTGETVSISGRDFRFKPETGEFEAVSGQSQFGRSRTDAGDWFGCNNSNPLWHFPLEEAYLKRNPHSPPPSNVLRVDVPEIPGASPVYPISRFQARYNEPHGANHFTSANSAHVYRDDLFPQPAHEAKPRAEATGEWSIAITLQTPPKTIRASDRVLKDGDRVAIRISVEDAPPLDSMRQWRVGADGTIGLPLLGAVAVGGKTGEQAVIAIRAAYAGRNIFLGPMTVTLTLDPPQATENAPLQVFISEPVHNLISRQWMSPSGTTFKSVRPPAEQSSEFLASTDNWFRPTTIASGPDGALYIADMYRAVIEHPQWIPKDIQAKTDLRAGQEMGRIYRVVPVGAKRRPIPRRDKLDTAGLVAALNSSNGWQRDMAQAMLVWNRDAKAIPALEKLARESQNSLARLHALCALEALAEKSNHELLRTAMTDTSPLVRRHAIRIAGKGFGGTADRLIAEQLSADEPPVRLALAYALASWDDDIAPRLLAKLLVDADSDRFLIAAALSSLHEKNIVAVAQAVTGLAHRDPPSPPVLAGLLRTALGVNQPQAIAATLQTLTAAKDGKHAPWQFHTLANLLDSLEESRTAANKVFDAQAAQSIMATVTSARALVADNAAPLESRAAALSLLGRDPATRKEDFATLDRLLSPQSPREIQSAIISTLARRREVDAAKLLLAHWKGLTPDLRAAAVDGLLARADRAALLLDAVDSKAILALDIDAPRRQRLLQYPDKAIRTRAEKLFAQSINPDRQKVIDAFAEAITLNGDAKKGQPIFAKTCATCHRLGETGNAVGPDLASVGDKSSQGLLVSILDPNRAVEPRYVNYIATTNDNETLTGLLASESATAITLIGADAKPIEIRRQDLKELRSSNSSLMPEGLEANLTPRDLADLMAFIRGGK